MSPPRKNKDERGKRGMPLCAGEGWGCGRRKKGRGIRRHQVVFFGKSLPRRRRNCAHRGHRSTTFAFAIRPRDRSFGGVLHFVGVMPVFFIAVVRGIMGRYANERVKTRTNSAWEWTTWPEPVSCNFRKETHVRNDSTWGIQVPERWGGEGSARNHPTRPVPTLTERLVWQHFERSITATVFAHQRICAEQADLNCDVR